MKGVASPGMEHEKQNPLDFALWKASKPGEPSWESPWGRGRPGWHIECSAMCLKYLGNTLDIHGGGQDLVFPHHENEIAQSECFTSITPFVRYWMHNGLMQLGKEKMSKSVGNLVTVKEILRRFSPDAVRFFAINSHYRSPLTYSEEGLEAAERGVERLRQAAWGEEENKLEGKIDPKPHREEFIRAMDDDFNTSRALSSLFDLAREINKGREEGRDTKEAQQTLVELTKVLGLTLKKEKRGRLDAQPFIELLISLRSELRQAKRWDTADKIRSSLAELGVILEDTNRGTVWKYRKTKT
jgi:cysteinyl-tRNA synthetase